jgi:hypothetical protein
MSFPSPHSISSYHMRHTASKDRNFAPFEAVFPLFLDTIHSSKIISAMINEIHMRIRPRIQSCRASLSRSGRQEFRDQKCRTSSTSRILSNIQIWLAMCKKELVQELKIWMRTRGLKSRVRCPRRPAVQGLPMCDPSALHILYPRHLDNYPLKLCKPVKPMKENLFADSAISRVWHDQKVLG